MNSVSLQPSQSCYDFPMLHNGIYEQVINQKLNDEIVNADQSDRVVRTAPLDAEESSKVMAKYVRDVTEMGLDHIRDKGGSLQKQAALVNKIIDIIKCETDEPDFGSLSVLQDRSSAEQCVKELLAVMDRKNSSLALDEKQEIVRPETSIAESSLFTGAVHEPQMFTELKKEIVSCDRIDMLVSFIKWSGLRLIINELTDFARKGGEFRIITTSYMGATDIKAVEELSKLPNIKIKVSYDTKRTRLHAKTYVFYRDTGFTTAYIGSSNLSNVAISSGLEWNVKVTRKDLPETMDKITATFESYWNSNEFEYYDEGQKERLARALDLERHHGSNDAVIYSMDVSPYSYQQEILDKLQAERDVRGYYSNLVVAATGTGKTVVAAFDYKRFVKENPHSSCRLLFIAHRAEILEQSLNTFRAVLKDANFGELYVGNYRPDSIDHLFVSIQTFNSQQFTEKTNPDFYDYIVVDEFHHAAAESYQKLLAYYKPKILLGLTATPERMDGKSILPYFHNRIAAEIRLPEAIERKLLCPFQYFGVTDSVDLESIRWSAGGYDRHELSNLYTESGSIARQRAGAIIVSLQKYVTSMSDVKGLGFCVSIAHAEFMNQYFNEHGISSMVLTGDSPDEDRENAKNRLVCGEVRFIFVVDIYNEGVDIPEVNTVLFLRPTESLTVFLQQLGRGLRLAEGKDCLTVLDFIGQANRKYNFEDKFAALLCNANHSVIQEIKNGFVSVPKGCYIQLEKKASRYILDNIRAAYGRRDGLVSRVASFSDDTGMQLTLANFLDYYHLDPRDIYRYNDLSFTRLCVIAGKHPEFHEDFEKTITKSFMRFATVNSRRWIAFIRRILTEPLPVSFTPLEQRMLQMLQFTIWQESFESSGFTSITDGVIKIRNNPVMCQELLDLLDYNLNHVDFVDEQVDIGFDCPLDLHCTYSRDQLLVALDYKRPKDIGEGVKWLPDEKIDVLFVTLNKSDKDYSPTTMYNDYSINDRLFHWQSQSTTSQDSATGQRYIHHHEQGSRVLLFAREYKNDRIYKTASAYTYLGTVEYVSHDGSKPMNITWKLDRPIPARFLRKTSKLIAG